MIPADAFKMNRYFHHKDFHKPHHSHANRPQADVSTQKSGTREIKIVRGVLDVNEKMAGKTAGCLTTRASSCLMS